MPVREWRDSVRRCQSARQDGHVQSQPVISASQNNNNKMSSSSSSSLLLTVLLLVTGGETYQTEYRTLSVTPVITTEPRNHRAPVTDEVTLHCNPQHLGKFVVVWKHGPDVLTAGKMMVSPDPRYSLASGFNLRINNIRPGDAGTYSCSISTYGDPVTLTHSLEILGKSK